MLNLLSSILSIVGFLCILTVWGVLRFMLPESRQPATLHTESPTSIFTQNRSTHKIWTLTASLFIVTLKTEQNRHNDIAGLSSILMQSWYIVTNLICYQLEIQPEIQSFSEISQSNSLLHTCHFTPKPEPTLLYLILCDKVLKRVWREKVRPRYEIPRISSWIQLSQWMMTVTVVTLRCILTHQSELSISGTRPPPRSLWAECQPLKTCKTCLQGKFWRQVNKQHWKLILSKKSSTGMIVTLTPSWSTSCISFDLVGSAP